MSDLVEQAIANLPVLRRHHARDGESAIFDSTCWECVVRALAEAVAKEREALRVARAAAFREAAAVLYAVAETKAPEIRGALRGAADALVMNAEKPA